VAMEGGRAEKEESLGRRARNKEERKAREW
jgi:hypothetical protein